VSNIAFRLVLVFSLAVVMNYLWELAQTPLYAGVEFPGAIWHCFVAALGDGLLVLLVFGAVAAATRSLDWYQRPGARDYLAMVFAGLVVGFAVEWWGLHVAQRWVYSDLMPRIPGTGVGAAPILQMLVLPPAIFGVMRRFTPRAV
jgi:hypothetical protein